MEQSKGSVGASWRTMAAILLYVQAAGSLVLGLFAVLTAQGTFERRADTGDFTGAAMMMWAGIAWFLPLAVGTTLIAFVLRSHPRDMTDSAAAAIDRRWMLGLLRLGRTPRAVAAASLVVVAFLLEGGVAVTTLPLLARPTPHHELTDYAFALAFQVFVLFGPLLVLALGCVGIAARLYRAEPIAREAPTVRRAAGVGSGAR